MLLAFGWLLSIERDFYILATITRRDFMKLSFYSFAGVLFGQKWSSGWVFAPGLELSGQFNFWGQSDLTIGNLKTPFSYLPPFPPHLKEGRETG